MVAPTLKDLFNSFVTPSQTMENQIVHEVVSFSLSRSFFNKINEYRNLRVSGVTLSPQTLLCKGE